MDIAMFMVEGGLLGMVNTIGSLVIECRLANIGESVRKGVEGGESLSGGKGWVFQVDLRLGPEGEG